LFVQDVVQSIHGVALGVNFSVSPPVVQHLLEGSG
jgi:hypothetical protein